MKEISELIKKLPENRLQELAKNLGIREKKGNLAEHVHNTMMSYTGFGVLLSSLPADQRKLLYSIYLEKDGITYDELGKRNGQDSERIEKNINDLSERLLVYILKNRQKISNKLDKVFLNTEIRDILNPMDKNSISSHFSEIGRMLEKKEYAKPAGIINSIRKHPNYNIIEFIFNSGGLVFIDELNDMIPQKSGNKIFLNLANNKYINIYHDLSETGKTVILLDKKVYAALAHDLAGRHQVNLNVNNRYNLLLNFLKTYDTISTYGLFLTKQYVFRKIDKKHLENSMIKLKELNGTDMNSGAISQLTLYFLYMQDCIHISNDMIVISLKKINGLLSDPFNWLVNIIRLLDGSSKDESLFKPPFRPPEYPLFVLMLELIYKYNNNPYSILESAFISYNLSQLSSDKFDTINEERQKYKNVFQLCLRFFCVTGILEIERGIIKLSDIGFLLAEKELLKSDHQEINLQEKKNAKNIYLNPDFTMIVPKKEIQSEALYHILTHTEIINDDVILNVRISRESILTSLKRGMTNDKFLAVLGKQLKNEIPGNLNFLISEWMNQTINVKIFNAVLLKTNPSFIDKLVHSKIRSSVVSRIADQFAVINKKYIDKIIKMAKANDAVINLFDDNGND